MHFAILRNAERGVGFFEFRLEIRAARRINYLRAQYKADYVRGVFATGGGGLSVGF
jgi:hypothetical protein